MSNFKAGFARLDITPPLGVNMAGYFSQRIADGILDKLHASAVAVSDDTNISVIISLDLLGLKKDKMYTYRKSIADKLSLPIEAVFIACTHTHTGPVMSTRYFSEDLAYNNYLQRKLCDVATIAIADLKSATVSIGRSIAPGISFVRRFRMKDGSMQNVCLAGVPGEPFTDIGRGIKENSSFEMTLVSCCANGYEGYFPMKSAYDEGGYEVVTSSFKAGVAEAIIEGSTELINTLK